MNDFLHSLRTGKDKRYDRTRRGNDNAPFRTNERHGGTDKRRRGNYTNSNAAENAYVTIAKVLPPVKTLLETIVSDRKDFLEIEERKVLAMETIARYLQKIAGDGGGDSPPVQSREETAVDRFSSTISDDPEDVSAPVDTTPIDRIGNLRAQGFSFDKIARQLEMEKIPTPSGRGNWRGQMVSKLLKSGENR